MALKKGCMNTSYEVDMMTDVLNEIYSRWSTIPLCLVKAIEESLYSRSTPFGVIVYFYLELYKKAPKACVEYFGDFLRTIEYERTPKHCKSEIEELYRVLDVN